MDRLHAMRVFVQVAEAAGFSEAARQLRISPTAVSRLIGALENHLGARLLLRTTRVVRLTDAGLRFYQDCRRILGEVQEAEDAARGQHASPRGELTVTAPAMFGRMFVLPIVLEYLETNPEVRVRSVFVDRTVNLVDDGVDVAIRIGELQDSALRAARAGAVRHVVCGAPAYFEEHGEPRVPEDLGRHTIVAVAGPYSPTEWRFSRGGAPLMIPVAPRLTTVTNDAAIEAVVRGHGLTRVISYQIAPQLAEGALKTVLTSFEPSPMPIHVLHTGGRRVAAKVRSFVDLAVERLRAKALLN